MLCRGSCLLSFVFIVAMIYFTHVKTSQDVYSKFIHTLDEKQKKVYESIVQERAFIYYFGYVIGFLLSLLFIYYNLYVAKRKMDNYVLICTIISISFITSYFYYTLTPKTKYMLNYLTEREQIDEWLNIYKNMKMNYHIGLVLGLVSVGFLGFAFRCY